MNSENNSPRDSADSLRTEPLGDSAMRILLPEVNDGRAMFEALRTHPQVIDVVVTERHACVYFNPAAPPDNPATVLEKLIRVAGIEISYPTITIRARYDGADLARVADYAHITPDELIEIHAAQDYTVRIVGFMPGFAYLGEVDARIAAPRLATPRTRVPAHAVGVAGRRTGVYPFAAPGGWNLIATAIDFIAFDEHSGARLQLGDRVRFERV